MKFNVQFGSKAAAPTLKSLSAQQRDILNKFMGYVDAHGNEDACIKYLVAAKW